MSKNLLLLQKKLLEQRKWLAKTETFQRTYAGRNLLKGGAFSWTMKCADLNRNNREICIGSCYPLRYFAKSNIRIDVYTGWDDIELIPQEIEKSEQRINGGTLMIAWDKSCNWTYQDFLNEVTLFLSSDWTNKKCLDCEHSSVENMKEMVKWAESLGVDATISFDLEYIILTKREVTKKCACDGCFHNCKTFCDFTKYRKKVFNEPDDVTDARLAIEGGKK